MLCMCIPFIHISLGCKEILVHLRIMILCFGILYQKNIHQFLINSSHAKIRGSGSFCVVFKPMTARQQC